MLFESRQKGLIRRDCPIYIGGLSAKLSEVYDRLSGQTRRQHPNLRLLEEVAPFVLSGQSAGEAPMRGGRIYALSSGMMTENTLSNLFAGKVMEHREHAIFFIGYCDPATPGGRIIDAAHGASIDLGENQPARRLECEVERFHFSGHATRESLRDYVNRVRPKTVLLVHGEPAAAAWFVETLGHDLPGTRVLVPGPGEKIEL
jgi:Cft2 family RNA processing exonuclease